MHQNTIKYNTAKIKEEKEIYKSSVCGDKSCKSCKVSTLHKTKIVYLCNTKCVFLISLTIRKKNMKLKSQNKQQQQQQAVWIFRF